MLGKRIGFQSTPPVKAATGQILAKLDELQTISIHAAREGGDLSPRIALIGQLKFQSTPPVKAATLCRIRLSGD